MYKAFAKTGGQGGIIIQTYVGNDEVTPAITSAANNSHPVLVLGMFNAAKRVKQIVAQAYENAKMGVLPNSPATIRIKGGSTPLHDSGDLEKAMKDEGGITMSDDGRTVTASINWMIPEAGTKGVQGQFRKNQQFEYLWAQEFGAKMTKVAREDAAVVEDTSYTLPPRAFFMQALQRAQFEAGREVAIAYAPVIDAMRNVRRIPTKGFGVQLMPSMFGTSTIGMLMYFAPPSILYAYYGAASDLMGAWSGSLLSQRQMFGWGRQYMWGQVGATKKSIRRKFRRQLWA